MNEQSKYMLRLQTRHSKCDVCGKRFHGATKWHTEYQRKIHMTHSHPVNKLAVEDHIADLQSQLKTMQNAE